MIDLDTLLARTPRTHFIAGELTSDEPTLAVENPATGQTLTTVADGGAKEALRALDAACRAQQAWAATPPRERSEILRKAYELTVAATDDLAALMTLEMGKPLAEARGEVVYGAEFLRWFAEEAVRIDGRWTVAPAGDTRILVAKRPVGPVLAITPWNFPLSMATRKIGPALAAGCTMVIKPAQLTPLTMLRFMVILRDAGVPAGVVSCVVSSSAKSVSEPLMADPRLRKLTFTGSTEVGRGLLEQASERVLRTSMELGGCAPFVVLADADLDIAVEAAMAAKYRNNGEACTAANRFIVHESLVAEFTDRLVEASRAKVLGDGMADGTTLGPLINQAGVDKALDLIQDAVSRGATVRCGGAQEDKPGYYLPATVLADVPPDARIHREEVFGPVAPVTSFRDEDEAVRLANDTEFGLIAYLCTRDIARGIRVGERLEAGMLGLNAGVISNPAAPFGGVKQSGLGREGGAEGIGEYLETTYVGIGGLR